MALLLPLFLAVSVPGLAQGVRPHVVLEGLDGKERPLALSQLDLKDPREAGAWFVRPVGLTPPRAEGPETPTMGAVRLGLASGDRLQGRIAGGEGETLEVLLVGNVLLALDVGQLASLVLPEHLPPGYEEELGAPAEGDRLYRRAGESLDPIDGTLIEFGAEGVRFESDLIGARSFPWGEVAALFVEVFDDERGPEPEGVPVALDLVDGGRLRGRLVHLDGSALTLRVSAGEPLRIELAFLRELFVDDGRLRFLSDLVPLGEEGRGSPFGDDLGMVWPFRVDRSVLGGELRCGGRVFHRGLGVHAPSRLRYDLGGAWSRLRALVGVDDSALLNAASARGSVIFRVYGDGRLLWESDVLRGGDEPQALPELDVSGVGELVLEADPAGDFGGDRANWLRPICARE